MLISWILGEKGLNLTTKFLLKYILNFMSCNETRVLKEFINELTFQRSGYNTSVTEQEKKNWAGYNAMCGITVIMDTFTQLHFPSRKMFLKVHFHNGKAYFSVEIVNCFIIYQLHNINGKMCDSSDPTPINFHVISVCHKCCKSLPFRFIQIQYDFTIPNKSAMYKGSEKEYCLSVYIKFLLVP